MEWYGVLATVLGAIGGIGGIGGIISIYTAKSNKDKIDISNMQDMLDAAHKLHDDVVAEKESIKKDFEDYKSDTMKYIAEFKERFKKTEDRLDKAEFDILSLRKIIFSAYRCPFPKNITDCPVLKDYEKTHNSDSTDCSGINN